MGWRVWDHYKREQLSWCRLTIFALTAAITFALLVRAARAENIYCYPGSPSVEWGGQRWQVPGYSGPLTEVTISNSFGPTMVTCVRNSIAIMASPKGHCHFKAGTKTSSRTYKKMEWTVCRTDKDMNMSECVVECDD